MTSAPASSFRRRCVVGRRSGRPVFVGPGMAVAAESERCWHGRRFLFQGVSLGVVVGLGVMTATTAPELSLYHVT